MTMRHPVNRLNQGSILSKRFRLLLFTKLQEVAAGIFSSKIGKEERHIEVLEAQETPVSNQMLTPVLRSLSNVLLDSLLILHCRSLLKREILLGIGQSR